MPADFRGAVEAVKNRLDIVELVGRYTELRQAGTRFVGVCPFHHETKPSFSVHPEKGFYYCFGCQASGDVLDFYCKVNGVEFREGLETLAREFGIELSTRPNPQGDQTRQLRSLCLDMHAAAQEYFQQCLRGLQGQVARDYLVKRRMDEAIVQKFGLGWSPEDWQGLSEYLKKRNFDQAVGVQAGLLAKSETGRVYDRFRGRVTFPIQDVGGRTIAFGGRIIADGDPKYLNSPETPIYKKGEHLFGLNQARQAVSQAKRVLLTEGYVDVMALHQFGFVNSCGVLGTALTTDQVKRLAGFCGQVDLVFDGDRAGMAAAFRSAEMILAYGLQCRAVVLPEGEDADSLLRVKGAAAFQEYLNKSIDGLDFCLQMVSSRSPRDIAAWASSFLAKFKDSALKGFYIPKISAKLGLAEKELRDVLVDQARGGVSSGRIDSHPGAAGAFPQRDRELLGFVLRYPQHLTELEQQGLAQALQSEKGKILWQKLLSHGPDEARQHMDEGEKAFFVLSQVSDEDENVEATFRELLELISKNVVRKSRKDLLRQLREAELAGDDQVVRRLLGELKMP